MLVLTRKAGQSITILDNIEVTILEVRGDSVRIGIKAPSVVPVHRSEIVDSVRAQNLRAAAAAAELQPDELDAALSGVKNPVK